MKEKRKLSPEELSRIRSEAGRKGANRCRELGHFRGGRPAGAKNDPTTLVEPTISLSVAVSDREILRRYAYRENTTLKDAFHRLMAMIAPQLEAV